MGLGDDSPSYRGIAVAQLAAAYDWLHDQMSADTRDAVKAELEKQGMDLVKFCRNGSSPIYYSRYPGAVLGIVTAGLALHGDSPKAEEMLAFFRTWGVNEYFRGQQWIDGAAIGGNYDYMDIYQAISHIAGAWWSGTGENLVDWATANQGDWLNKLLLFELWAILPDNRFYKTGDMWGGDSYFARVQYQMPLDILTRMTRSGHGRTKQMLMNELMGPGNYHGSTAFIFFIYQDPTIEAKPLSDLATAAVWAPEFGRLRLLPRGLGDGRRRGLLPRRQRDERPRPHGHRQLPDLEARAAGDQERRVLDLRQQAAPVRMERDGGELRGVHDRRHRLGAAGGGRGAQVGQQHLR